MADSAPKLLGARQRVSAALMQASLQPNKNNTQAQVVPEQKKKKKGAVAALLAATGQF